MDFQQGLISTVHDYSLGNLDAVAFNRELSQRPTTLLKIHVVFDATTEVRVLPHT